MENLIRYWYKSANPRATFVTRAFLLTSAAWVVEVVDNIAESTLDESGMEQGGGLEGAGVCQNVPRPSYWHESLKGRQKNAESLLSTADTKTLSGL